MIVNEVRFPDFADNAGSFVSVRIKKQLLSEVTTGLTSLARTVSHGQHLRSDAMQFNFVLLVRGSKWTLSHSYVIIAFTHCVALAFCVLRCIGRRDWNTLTRFRPEISESLCFCVSSGKTLEFTWKKVR